MGSANVPEGLVKKETMIIAALVAVIVGFIGGVLFSSFKAPLQTVPVAQSNGPQQQTGQQAPAGPSAQQAAKISSLVEEVKANPKNVAAWTELGNLYFDSNQPGNSITAYKKSLELNQAQPDVWTDLGVMYKSTGQFKEAIAAFDQAIRLNPNLEAAWFNKGLVLIHDLKDKNGGLAAWQKVLAINPEAHAPSGQALKELVAALGK
jgi:tetratricopeptide (TPR) repeat protein